MHLHTRYSMGRREFSTRRSDLVPTHPSPTSRPDVVFSDDVFADDVFSNIVITHEPSNNFSHQASNEIAHAIAYEPSLAVPDEVPDGRSDGFADALSHVVSNAQLRLISPLQSQHVWLHGRTVLCSRRS